MALSLVLPLAASARPSSGLPTLASGTSAAAKPTAKVVKPIDKQKWENPDHMTWDDYTAIPDTAYAAVDQVPSVRKFKIAVVLGDFTDQPFLVTQPVGSHPFGNPQIGAHDIDPADVAQFYHDLLNTPNDLNHGHTMNEYWMEDTYGAYGVDLTAFGAYHLPGKLHEYGLGQFQGGQGCPAGDSCFKDIRTDLGGAWIADVGQEEANKYELVFYLTAGHDESGTWQEFGEMKFQTKEDVTDEFGPPDASLPNWNITRYVPWTSWLASANHWPNAGGGSSTQAESSGTSTYAHELSHLFGIGDNYNNPYGTPLSRSYSGIWDMLSRGTFNGPGGPHKRWVVPANRGSTMGAQHMLRNKIKLGVIDDSQWLSLTRGALDDSGMITIDVTAREVAAGGAGIARKGSNGLNIALDGGDLSDPCDYREDYLCDRGNYNNYTVEVVDRMGTDSFTPDSGVLLAKTKNADSAPFIWVVDANPQDINLVDFTRPDGSKAMVSLGDYRQLADALFHAGTKSKSEYEYIDAKNKLHFYILDLKRDKQGVLSYTVAVKSLDGDGPHHRGVKAKKGKAKAAGDGVMQCVFPVKNTGQAEDVSGTQPEDVSKYVAADVFRVKAKASDGSKIFLPRKIVGVDNGKTAKVKVRVPASATGKIKLKVKSESDKTAKSKATCSL
jgi:M6 family metalloprotease-like protein